MPTKGILAYKEKLYIPLYIFLLFSVSIHKFLGFEYFTPIALISPLLLFDFKDLGFTNYRSGFKWGIPFLFPAVLLFPSEGNIILVLNHAGVAFAEEMFFRGFLMRRYNNLTVSFLFTLPHIILYPSLGAILTFFPSLLFGYLYMKTGSVLASIFAHFSANIFYMGITERFDMARLPWEIGF